ncbi:MAG TPA: polyphosphate polymerase domain-containing protein [Bacteroidetes bacterium]|nr:polyphosphate polymerase domain-containing protein [Bacteroidota bacterium]
MQNNNNLLDTFKTISLEEMDSAQLMNRIDTKYTIPINKLEKILNTLPEHYDILSINNERSFEYHTVYFDTEDHKLYHLHQNGKLNRYKFRIREYCNTGNSFFEIKIKNNKGRTNKKRQSISGWHLKEKELDFIQKELDFSETLIPSLTINFKRFTLVNRSKTERVTIDRDLYYEHDDRSEKFSNIAIIEIKESKNNKASKLKENLKKERYLPTKISKYCVGISSLKRNIVKVNNIKNKLRQINKINII